MDFMNGAAQGWHYTRWDRELEMRRQEKKLREEEEATEKARAVEEEDTATR